MKNKNDNNTPQKNSEDKIEGRNAVLEALKAGLEINKLFVLKGEATGSLRQIISIARAKSVMMKETDRATLDSMSDTSAHQGVIAMVSPVKYVSLDDIFEKANSLNQPAFIIILDDICDPNNLGSILRTADAVGAHGVVIPKHNAAGVTSTVAKVSAGASAHVPVARVTNLASSIDYMKEKGLWIAGTDLTGEKPFFQSDLKGPLGIVIGSEGKGMGNLITRKCDFIVNIPMSGKISSLNAGVAAGIVLYEAYRQRQSL